RRLPSMADSETLLVRLLLASEIILVLGVLTGMATSFQTTGMLFALDHKTLFTFVVLLLVAGLLFAHFRTGVRGRAVARMVLLSYLLLTLGYPGVKFVTDIMIG
ncbi:MAG: cytochrome c biogenesis protein CcsA, partial [Rhodospirillales bacterium]|nr:cytochrome c biogenesis protein CcsA [Rhodospirillales bacterium]